MKTLSIPPIAAAIAVAAALHCQAAVSYSTILDLNQSVTGVRGYDDTTVLLTGSVQSQGETVGMWWQGSLSTGAGTVYTPVPPFQGQTVTTSIFYGPNTAMFESSFPAGTIRIVGSYQYSQSTVLNHGFMYTGPLNGVGGEWLQIDVPSNSVGGATVENTIPHSNMGDYVVGDYDLQGVPASGNAFLYKISNGAWTILTIGGSTSNLTTAYGIWQNGTDSYTIAGGSMHLGANKAFLVDYTPSTQQFTHLKYFAYDDAQGLSHFEGITQVDGGYNVVATTDVGAAYAFISRNNDTTFGEAIWTPILYPGSDITTGNTVFENIAMGIYIVSGAVHSYTATVVPDQGVAVSVAKSGKQASFTITNTGDAAASFGLSTATNVTNTYAGPGRKPPLKRLFTITYTLGGANITTALESGSATTGSIAPGASVTVVEKVKVHRKVRHKRTIRTTITATGASNASASASVTLVLRPN